MADKEKLNKIDVEFKAADGSTGKLVVLRPTRKDEQEAELIYNKAYAHMFQEDYLLLAEVEKVARAKNLWDDSREARVKELENSIKANTKIVLGQVKGTTKAEARQAAIQMRKDRYELLDIRSKRSELEGMTAERQAEQRKFEFLVSKCTKTESGKPFFASVTEYLERDDEAPRKAADAFLNLYYGLDPDFQKKLPESKFLIKYRMVNEKLQLVNAEGKPVDEKNRLINTEGRLVNADGKLINEAGELVDEDGNPVGEVFEFLE